MANIRIQELADMMGVSRTTVWKALNNRPGVSDEVRKRIFDRACEAGIIDRAQGEPHSPHPHRKCVSVAVARMESSVFWMNIIHNIAIELARHDVDLMYTCLPSAAHDDYRMPAAFENVSGVIVLNVYDEKLLMQLAQLNMPKVFLDTVPGVPFQRLNGDLVLVEGLSATSEITRRLLETKRTRLGFIGDPHYAQTNADRYQGFLCAHQALGFKPDPALSLVKPIDMNRYREEIGDFLDHMSEIPDGFVCASDFVAQCVMHHLNETKRLLPERFELTGFDNSQEFESVAGKITTTDVQTHAIGRRLAQRILFLIDYPNTPSEVSYIMSSVMFRGSLSLAAR